MAGFRYEPGYYPVDERDIDILSELKKISRALEDIRKGKHDILHAEPEKVEDGMVVFADGTDWNPGTGAGVYARVSGAWTKL